MKGNRHSIRFSLKWMVLRHESVVVIAATNRPDVLILPLPVPVGLTDR